MGVIHLLDKQVSQLIAAGEVVERPSSVAKELIENALDAGATLVTVEIQHGGVTYLRVSDNGCGIAPEDVPRVFLRHATSKIRTQEDLGCIGTLGFRGEAMASIHAVCRVQMLTRTPDSPEGTRYQSDGGENTLLEPAGCPVGTTIIVRDIFFNTPARMKFLKKDVSEGNSVAGVVEKMALSHPEVSFKFIRDGQLRLHTPGDGQLLSAIHAVLGRELARQMIPVQYQEGPVQVTGYVTKPTAARSNRTLQNFFVNGRFVRSRTAAAALEEAFRHSIMVGKFPACVLNLSLPAAQTDVNVHPAKIEVRFTSEKPVFDAVYYGVKSALAQLDDQPVAPASAGMNLLELSRREETAAQLSLSDTPKKQQPPQRVDASQYRKMVGLPPVEPAPKAERNTAAPQAAQQTTSQPQAGKLRTSVRDLPARDPAVKRAWQQPLQQSMQQTLRETPPAPQQKDPASDQPATLRDEGASWGAIPVPEAVRSAFQKEAAPAQQEPLPQEETVPTPPKVEPAPEGEQASPEESILTEEAPQYRLIGELFGTYILLEGPQELVLIDKHAAHERLIFQQLREQGLSGSRQLLLEPLVVTLSREDYAAAQPRLEEFARLGFLVEDFGEGDLLVREVPADLDRQDIQELVEQAAHNMARLRADLTPQAVDDLLHSVACKSAIRAGDRSTLPELWQLVALLRDDGSVRYCPHGRPVARKLSRRELEKMFGRVQS